jgi:hypothetical protein
MNKPVCQLVDSEVFSRTPTRPLPSGTSSTTSTPSCTTPTIANATPPTSAANSPASHSLPPPPLVILPEEGPMQLDGSTSTADKSIDTSARKERGPQHDKDVFHALAKAGKRLAEIHVQYEQQPEYKLTKKVEKAGEKLDYRVTKMKLSKDKITLIYKSVPNPQRYPQRNLRIPPRQSLRPRMGYRPISNIN